MAEQGDIKPESPSFGGNVADLLGTLRATETGKPYKDSMDPLGNPFEGKSPEEMVVLFASTHSSPDDLEILEKRLDSFFGIEPEKEKPENLPDVYQKARAEIVRLLEEKKKAS